MFEQVRFGSSPLGKPRLRKNSPGPFGRCFGMDVGVAGPDVLYENTIAAFDASGPAADGACGGSGRLPGGDS